MTSPMRYWVVVKGLIELELSLKQVGVLLDVSPERARQILKDCLRQAGATSPFPSTRELRANKAEWVPRLIKARFRMDGMTWVAR